jgi:hypothetical protein
MSVQSEGHSKLRDLEETQETRHRETLRKLKLDLDEELKEKLRATERRYSDEADSLRTESMGYKRKYEDAAREIGEEAYIDFDLNYVNNIRLFVCRGA